MRPAENVKQGGTAGRREGGAVEAGKQGRMRTGRGGEGGAGLVRQSRMRRRRRDIRRRSWWRSKGRGNVEERINEERKVDKC